MVERDDEAEAVASPDPARWAHADQLTTLGTLAASVGHEINNPLTYVITNLTHVLAATEAGEALEPAELSSCLRDALEGAERIQQVIQDMRTLGRKPAVSFEPVDVEATLEIAIRQTMNHIKHRARLRTTLGHVPRVDADRGPLCQVFVNLLLNAAQAMPQGRAPHHEISVSTRLEDDVVVVEVSDSGSGIPEDVLPYVFDPFFTTKPPGEGTGLGLSVSNSIVRSFGGEMCVRSTPGIGTSFAVRLPKSSASLRPPPARAGSERAHDGERAQILAIDDDLAILRALRRSLRAQHDVRAIADAREALRILASGERFDVILCDLLMPDMTGMEFFRELEVRAPALARRVVFMTGGAFTADARAFLDATQNPRLNKPFSPGALANVIEQARSTAPDAGSDGFAPLEVDAVPTELMLRFPREWDQLDVVRESCGFFARAAFGDVVVGQRVSLVVHELVENAIKYSVPGSESVEVDVVGEGAGFEVAVSNRSLREHAARLQQSLADLTTSDPREAYMAAMLRCRDQPLEEGGLGLVRVAYEAGVELGAEYAAGRMRIVARGAL